MASQILQAKRSRFKPNLVLVLAISKFGGSMEFHKTQWSKVQGSKNIGYATS